MNTPELIPLIRPVLRHTLPYDVKFEAEDIALNIASDSDDRRSYRALNDSVMTGIAEDFAGNINMLELARLLLCGHYEQARNLFLQEIEARAFENVELREIEAYINDESPEWTMREVGPLNYEGGAR